jgi:hypothetical protein
MHPKTQQTKGTLKNEIDIAIVVCLEQVNPSLKLGWRMSLSVFQEMMNAPDGFV